MPDGWGELRVSTGKVVRVFELDCDRVGVVAVWAASILVSRCATISDLAEKGIDRRSRIRRKS